MTSGSELSLPIAPPHSVLVVGTGLIGTSIALALRAAGVTVTLDDTDERHLDIAIARGAGHRHRRDPPRAASEGQGVADAPAHVLVAVPPSLVAAVLLPLQRRYPDASFSDVASVKTVVERDIETSQGDLSRFVGGHPMAGRERGGPEHADPTLFVGRTWALCATTATSPAALSDARSVAQWCGAVPVITTAGRHDRAVALLSHLPQITASALSALAVTMPDADLRLAGQGWRDMTRIADSDAGLWAQIVESNGAALIGPLAALIAELQRLSTALSASDRQADGQPDRASPAEPHIDGETRARIVTREIVSAGNTGRRRLPDKDAQLGRWDRLIAVVEDRPGELARLLLAAGAAGVNVEDLQVEHQATQHTGEVTLHVAEGRADALATVLRDQGWRCRAESAAARTVVDEVAAGPGAADGASPVAAAGGALDGTRGDTRGTDPR